MESAEFLDIRRLLGRTQVQLAQILCVSTKAIQSFEQGWRRIPTHIEREMLLLLSLKRTSAMDSLPKVCWEVKNCPEEWKKNCLVWALRVRHFCWYLNGTYCQGKINKNWDEKIHLCRECEVYTSMFTADLNV